MIRTIYFPSAILWGPENIIVKIHILHWQIKRHKTFYRHEITQQKYSEQRLISYFYDAVLLYHNLFFKKKCDYVPHDGNISRVKGLLLVYTF